MKKRKSTPKRKPVEHRAHGRAWVIESEVAPPPRTKGKYPFSAMNIGDSVIIDGDRQLMWRARNSAYLYGSRTSKRFSCRKVGLGQWRIWRIG